MQDGKLIILPYTLKEVIRERTWDQEIFRFQMNLFGVDLIKRLFRSLTICLPAFTPHPTEAALPSSEELPKRIDAIHVEQPWLWPVALKRILFPSVILIYGSQNIEMPLKKEILTGANLGDCSEVLKAVDNLEKQAARESNLCFAVTNQTARSFPHLAPAMFSWHQMESSLGMQSRVM